MLISDFGLWISQGKETAEGYVQLKHSTEYTVNLRNNGKTPCDAILTIDGNKVGTYRVDAYGSFNIERPPNVERNFIFLKIDTQESLEADLQLNDNLGLVTVEFIPAHLPPLELYGYGSKGITGSLDGGVKRTTRSAGGGASVQGYAVNNSRGISAGGTGLGSESNQKFTSAKSIDHDFTKRVTINLRLVAVEDRPTIIPLRSNNIPPSLL